LTELTFLTPLAALVAVVALVPLAAVAWRERRAARLRRALGLAAPRRLARLSRAVAVVALVGLLAVAAAQPALREHPASALVRRDAQAFFVVDVSRSMLAAPEAGGPTRFARAVAFAERMRASLADVPAGVASFTDRVLPNLFPSSDAAAFDLVAERALAIDQPPPALVHRRSTDFSALGDLASANYFAPTARRRLVVLVTDGESGKFDVVGTARTLRAARVDLIVVRFWHRAERIYARDGEVVTGYRPDAVAAARADQLGRAVSGLWPFAEDDVAGAAAAARRLLGHGPTAPAATTARIRPVSSYVAAAAALPLAFLLLGQGVRPTRRRRGSSS
jgi:hypothetical protein